MTTTIDPAAATDSSDFKVADLSLAEFGRKEIELAEVEMPGLMALRERYSSTKPLDRRAHHRLAAHDDPDRGAHRDPGRARRRGALGVVQHLLHPGPRRRGHRRRRHPGVRLEGRDARGVLVVHRPRAVVAGGRHGQHGPEHDPRRRWRRHAARAQGRRVRARRCRARPVDRRQRRVRGRPRSAPRRARRRRPSLAPHGGGPARRDRGDHHRRAPPLPDDGERLAAVPRHQRQRLGDEEQVRQPVRLPPLAGRRHLPRHRRDARGQGHGGLRIRRRRQGLRAVAARSGRACHRHRDRPDLRAAGGDGGLRGHHARGRRRDRRPVRHDDRQHERDHASTPWRG